jgi:hypothetical protein
MLKVMYCTVPQVHYERLCEVISSEVFGGATHEQGEGWKKFQIPAHLEIVIWEKVANIDRNSDVQVQFLDDRSCVGFAVALLRIIEAMSGSYELIDVAFDETYRTEILGVLGDYGPSRFLDYEVARTRLYDILFHLNLCSIRLNGHADEVVRAAAMDISHSFGHVAQDPTNPFLEAALQFCGDRLFDKTLLAHLGVETEED